jgi:hypothetical protein
MEKNCCSTSAKVSLLVSVVALAVAGGSYFCHKGPCGSGCICQHSGGADDNLRAQVLEIIEHNAQKIMDALGKGMAKDRENSLKQTEKKIIEDKGYLKEKSIILGDKLSKVIVCAFFDPLCDHCRGFQRDVVKILKTKKNICFYLLPLAAIGEDSVTIAKIYYALYERSPERAVAFMEYVANSTEPMNKDEIEKGLKVIGITAKDIEKAAKEQDKIVAGNGQKAQEYAIQFIPTVFSIVGNQAKTIKNPTLETLLKIADGESIYDDESANPDEENSHSNHEEKSSSALTNNKGNSKQDNDNDSKPNNKDIKKN